MTYRVIVFSHSGLIFDKTIRADHTVLETDLIVFKKDGVEILIVPAALSVIEKI